MADGGIGALVHLARGVQVVTDRDRCANAEHICALVFERILVLKAAKLSPRVVELARHTKEVLAVLLKELGAHRHKVVAAPSGGQVLKLVVRLIGVELRVIHTCAAVVEYGCILCVFVHDTRQVLHHPDALLGKVSLGILKVRRIKAHLAHSA